MPPNAKDPVMHASMAVSDTVLMGADSGPRSPYEGPMRSGSLSLQPTSVALEQTWFAALAEGGTMPYQKTFWAAGFGVLVNPFGVYWMVNGESEESAGCQKTFWAAGFGVLVNPFGVYWMVNGESEESAGYCYAQAAKC